MDYLADDPLLLGRLLIGLEALHEGQQKRMFYPYPQTLRVAWNALSVSLLATKKASPPGSLSGLLALCKRPLGEWFPAPLPLDFPPETRLLYSGDGIELTDTASLFLSESIYRKETIFNLDDAAQVERVLQNKQFAEIIERLRAATGSQRAQQDYVQLRRFLISKPFATTLEIVSAFNGTSIRTAEVGNFYLDCHPEQEYHCCPNCGPLFRQYGRWRGTKPDVCSDHAASNEQPRNVPYQMNLRYLTTAIHERVCLHGIEEVRWLDAVHMKAQSSPDAITQIEEWPGVDCYDLRLTFSDGVVWAADMKDYRSPEHLAEELEPIWSKTEALKYDYGFYVIPDRREQRRPGYRRQALEAAKNLPNNHQLLTVTEFLRAVEIQMKKSRRQAKKEKRA